MRYVKILLSLVIIFLVAYFVTQNTESVSVAITPGWSIKNISVGLLIIIIFSLGVATTALLAGYFGIKNYFREQTLLRRDKIRKASFDTYFEARSFAAAGMLDSAEKSWRQIIKKDSDNIMAKLELAEVLKAKGQILDALKQVEDARSKSKNNIEVLMLAAELNLQLNNKTAAIDNLALVLYQQTSVKAASLARDLSEELGRIDDAIEYHNKAVEAGEIPNSKEISERLQVKKILAISDSENKLLELKKFVRSHPHSKSGILALADTELANANKETAAELYAKLAGITESAEDWNKAAKIWLELKKPEQAISAAKLLAKDGQAKNLYMQAQILLQLGMLDDSLAVLNKINSENDLCLNKRVKILRSNVALQLGQKDLALSDLEDLSKN